MEFPKNHSKWCNSKGPYSPFLSCCVGDLPDDQMVDWLADQWHRSQQAWWEEVGRTTKLRQAMEQIRERMPSDSEEYAIATQILQETIRSFDKRHDDNTDS